ncbi:M14-type cytosolic carboxypeptidase [Roseimaritima sediminicola]|uniref:M14-type cytosolic carboxypeptidase n=1 Tax=Roseimaritima sediminicola TaxID=2662066 RepID=UPI001386BC17|nr:M14-type cytosolic carboxypeptidase [Roseimaritima sediminicola]
MFIQNIFRLILVGLVITWLFAETAVAFTVSSDFPGGSAELRELNAAEGYLEIAPAYHDQRGWPCWWYFRVDGAQRGQQLTVRITPSTQSFREGRRLGAAWSLPQRAAISTDDVHWQQTEPGEIDRRGGTYTITAPASRFWMAWGPPFLPSHADDLLEAVAADLPAAERFELATTRQGRAVTAIRCGTPGAPHVVWVQARQHAWEAGSSWVGRGFLEWVASDAPEAVRLRAHSEIVFIPIMDVDNVALGAGGKEAVPRDHNRDWAEQPHYPEVAAAQRRIGELAEAGRLRVFLDLHNPGANSKQPFYFGPYKDEPMSAQGRRNYQRFLTLSVATMTEPLAMERAYQYASYIKTAEERGRMSRNWVADHSDDDVVALTLETAWNTPHSTTQGYMHVGRGLAQTVARYLATVEETSEEAGSGK